MAEFSPSSVRRGSRPPSRGAGRAFRRRKGFDRPHFFRRLFYLAAFFPIFSPAFPDSFPWAKTVERGMFSGRRTSLFPLFPRFPEPDDAGGSASEMLCMTAKSRNAHQEGFRGFGKDSMTNPVSIGGDEGKGRRERGSCRFVHCFYQQGYS